MKFNFWKKLAVFLGLAVGAVTMTACQSTSTTDGSIKFRQEGQTNMYYNESKTEKYALATFYVENGTIYDIKTWDFEVQAKVGTETQTKTRDNVDFYVGHGAYGMVTTTVQVPLTCTEITLTKASPNKILSAWETYLGWWIVAIVIVALSWIFFAAEILGKKLSGDQILEIFKANAGGTICIGLFIFILCMFPLFFGAWVPTVILVIAMLAGIVGCGIIGGITAAINKKHA